MKRRDMAYPDHPLVVLGNGRYLTTRDIRPIRLGERTRLIVGHVIGALVVCGFLLLLSLAGGTW